MKILYVYSDINCSCTRKCTFEIQKGFKKIDNPTDTLWYLELNENHFHTYDVIVFQRLGGNGGVISYSYLVSLDILIKKYKRKTLTVYTIDDLLVNDTIFKFLEKVDLVLVPNENYKKYYGKYNKNFDYFKTFIDVDRVEKIKTKITEVKDKSKFKILWASTGSLGSGFMHQLVPEIILNFPPDQLTIMGMGAHYFKRYSSNINILPILSFDQFIENFQKADVILNPISVDTPFYNGPVNPSDFVNCKSEIKYLNAAMAKIPIITSKSLSYSRAVINEENGYILDNIKYLWIKALLELKNNPKLRETLTKKAYEDVFENYNLKVTAKKLYDIYAKNFKKICNIKKSIVVKKNIIKQDINQQVNEHILGVICSNRKITQEFYCAHDNLTRIDLMAATYARSNKGSLVISVLGYVKKHKTVIRRIEVPCGSLLDNSWFSVNFEPIEDSKDKKYFLQIKGIDNSIKNSVTLYYSVKNRVDGDMYINKNKLEGSLSFKTFCKQ